MQFTLSHRGLELNGRPLTPPTEALLCELFGAPSHTQTFTTDLPRATQVRVCFDALGLFFERAEHTDRVSHLALVFDRHSASGKLTQNFTGQLEIGGKAFQPAMSPSRRPILGDMFFYRSAEHLWHTTEGGVEVQIRFARAMKFQEGQKWGSRRGPWGVAAVSFHWFEAGA